MPNTKLVSWTIPEYSSHERSRRWYITASVILALLLIYSFFTANFLFALILIIAAITVVLHDKHEPTEIEFAITEDGVILGAQFHEYRKFASFWIFYEPSQNKMLFLEFKNRIRPRLPIPLFNKNPLHLRGILLKYLKEDMEKENEPISEQLSRLLKL